MKIGFWRYLAFSFIGFANALPIPLMGSTLSIWLAEENIGKEIIGFFALMSLPFSFKILWTPLIDFVPFTSLKKQPRKTWIFFSILGMALSLLSISIIGTHFPEMLAVSLFVLSLFTGCFYIVGIAYELESLQKDTYGFATAYIMTGYRLGLLCGSAGALYLSSWIGWTGMFTSMGILLLLGSAIILFQSEPFRSEETVRERQLQFSKEKSLYKAFWREIISEPCCCFFQKREWLSIFLLLLLFKSGDHLLQSMQGPFYLSLDFSKNDLALAAKMFGMAATILGAFVSGYLLKVFPSPKTLGNMGIFHACSLISYCAMAMIGKSFLVLYLSVAFEHFSSGMAMTAFIYFLWSICDKRHAPIQYALMWSVYSFKADCLSFLGGILAAKVSWDLFFLVTFCTGFGAALIVYYLVTTSKRNVSQNALVPTLSLDH